jgi:hypothetical protein
VVGEWDCYLSQVHDGYGDSVMRSLRGGRGIIRSCNCIALLVHSNRQWNFTLNYRLNHLSGRVGTLPGTPCIFGCNKTLLPLREEASPLQPSPL